ncbi:MAG: hypothetical protein GY719_21955, partial [bacterium]|nr:hypothetical protein [bacterium]
MHSKQIKVRNDRASYVVKATRKHARDLARKLNRNFSPATGGEPQPDWIAIQHLAGHRVDQVRIDILQKDTEKRDALREVRRFRRQRDVVGTRLYNALSRIRVLFDATYGRGGCRRALGFGTPIPRKPVVMLRAAERAVERMNDPDLRLPRPALQAVSLDLARLATTVERNMVTLGLALEHLGDAQLRLRRAEEAKRKSMRRFDREVGPWTRLMSALCDLGGEESLAAGVRRRRRRR